jgi:hypothetical protein
MFTHNCICISTSKELLLTYSVIQSSFFFHNNLRRCLFTVVFASPHNRRTIANVFSNSKRFFTWYVEPRLLRSSFNSNLYFRTNKRMIITNVFSNSSIFTMILLTLTIVFASCTNRELLLCYNSICIPASIEELLLLTYSVTQAWLI